MIIQHNYEIDGKKEISEINKVSMPELKELFETHQHLSRTKWLKIVGSSAYDSVTKRNANTAKKLLKLVK